MVDSSSDCVATEGQNPEKTLSTLAEVLRGPLSALSSDDFYGNLGFFLDVRTSCNSYEHGGVTFQSY